MLKIQHLTKMYGNKKAVDDLSLHIFPGEIYYSKALAYSLHCTKNALATIKLAKAFSLLNYRINFVTVNFGFKFIEITFVFFCRVIFL